MSKITKKLSHVCPFKLNDTYETLYELHDKLGLNDEYLWNTSREIRDSSRIESMKKLLEASKLARDNLIIWYHKQTLFQLHVTISLLTAKIRFIEYKLGLCEAIDLHQSCSISLVDFSNIIAELTDHRLPKGQKKTMHMVSAEINLPIWLSHYRNQICHVPTESPNISILVELVAKSLNYMNESFWSKVINRRIFDAQKCIKFVETIANATKFTSINQKLTLKKNLDLGKKATKIAMKHIAYNTKVCTHLRNQIYYNSDSAISIILNYILQFKPNDRSKNLGLLVEQIILTQGCFEKLVFKLLCHFEEKPDDKIIRNWLAIFVKIISNRKKDILKKFLRKIGINISVKIRRYTYVPALKCCQIAYRLLPIDRSFVTILLYVMRPKLNVILGVERTMLLCRITKLSKKALPKLSKKNSAII